MARHKRIHSRRARARRAGKSRPATAGIDRLQEVSSNECLLFRRMPAFDRAALCCFPGAGTRPGFHPGEDVPGGSEPSRRLPLRESLHSPLGVPGRNQP